MGDVAGYTKEGTTGFILEVKLRGGVLGLEDESDLVGEVLLLLLLLSSLFEVGVVGVRGIAVVVVLVLLLLGTSTVSPFDGVLGLLLLLLRFVVVFVASEEVGVEGGVVVVEVGSSIELWRFNNFFFVSLLEVSSLSVFSTG